MKASVLSIVFVALTVAGWTFPSHSQAKSSLSVSPIEEIFEPDATKYSPDLWVKVAAVSYNALENAPLGTSQSVVDSYKLRIRQELTGRIREAVAHGAEVVITPEFGLVGYPDIPELPPEEDEFRNKQDIAPFAETLEGPSVTYFSALAKELQIFLIIGMAEQDGERFYNTVVALRPDGTIAARYRKINLFQLERNFLDPGTEAVTFDTRIFGRAALLICSDVYSFYPGTALAMRHPDVTFLSTSWAQYNTGWGMFTRYAMTYRQYMVAANQNYFPDTGVINPDGSAQSHIRQTPGTAYGYLPRRASI